MTKTITQKGTKKGWYASRQTHARQLPEFIQDLGADARRRGSAWQRREFIALASAFGATSATAYGMLGLAAPQKARAQTRQGGTLRASMRLHPVVDPRAFDWPEMGNIARQFCESLVRWERDLSFSPYLLEGWEVNADVTEYILKARRGVTWNNGDPFHAEDIVFNLTRWCEKNAEGNSMAGRMNALIDESSGKAKEGAITKLDDYTVRLRLDASDISIVAGMVDYPALIVHREFDNQGSNLSENPVGTGPFELVALNVGDTAEVRRRADNQWWKGTIALDGVKWTAYGDDPAAEIAAWEAGDIDVNFETTANIVSVLDAIGLQRTEIVTASTVVIRTNVKNPPYDSQQLRKAIQRAVDNEKVLRIG